MEQSFTKWPGDLADVGHDARERRADVRHVAVRWLAKLALGETRELCIVHDVCATALIAELFAPPPVGEEVRIELSDGQPFDGTIVWAGETIVEIRLSQTLDVVELVARCDATPQASPPGPSRLDISCQGWLECDTETVVAEICDLSQGGARIVAEAGAAIGQPMLLVIPGLPPIAGQVRWRSDGKIGIAFDEPLPFDRLTGWIVARDAQLDAHGQSRRWPRYSILLKTLAQLGDVAEPINALVHNIGRGGVLMTCRRRLHVGDALELRLGPAGNVAGRVVWVGGNDAGIEFTRTIDAEHVLHPLGERSLPPLLHHYVVAGRPGLNSHKTH